jgi:hypothetical protein
VVASAAALATAEIYTPKEACMDLSIMRIRRPVMVFAVAVLVAFAGVGLLTVTPARAEQSATCETLTATPLTERCTITEPTVTQSEQFYPIQFQAGDQVAISAGGCVQTGGSGLTWKR